jgi:hypothetical protein
MSDKDVEKFLSLDQKRVTEHTITHFDDFLKRLKVGYKGIKD